MTAVAAGMPNGRISTITQVKGAIELLRGGGWRLALVWLASGALYTGLLLGAVSTGGNVDNAFTTAAVVYNLGSALAGGVASALALRLMLSGHEGWLRLDRGLAEFVAISVALSAAITMLPPLYMTSLGPQAGDGPASLALAGLGVGFLGLLYVWLKLTLWPIGRLFGRRDMTPARSWRLMRKAGRGLVLGTALFSIPLFAVVAASMPMLIADQNALGRFNVPTVALQFVTAALVLAAFGLSAVIYRLRVEAPANVAEVFD